MTGSALVPIILIPVVIVALAAWLALVYYADAHPGYRTRKSLSEPGAAHAETASTAREREAATGRAA